MLSCIHGAGHGSHHSVPLSAGWRYLFLSLSFLHFISVSLLLCLSPDHLFFFCFLFLPSFFFDTLKCSRPSLNDIITLAFSLDDNPLCLLSCTIKVCQHSENPPGFQPTRVLASTLFLIFSQIHGGRRQPPHPPPNSHINFPPSDAPCFQTFNPGFRGMYHSGTSLLACICQKELGADFYVYIRLERREKRRWPIW